MVVSTSKKAVALFKRGDNCQHHCAAVAYVAQVRYDPGDVFACYEDCIVDSIDVSQFASTVSDQGGISFP